VAQAFGLPRALTAEGIKRYGFHGLSYEFIARALPQHSGRADGRVVVAHLGNGASMAAMVGRKCLATTLGFSTIDGLVMGTRCGNLDPGVILHLMETKGLGVKEMTKMLYKESGLLGVSGISQDMRTLLASDKPEAQEAVDLFCYRIVRELGSLAAAAGGLDALVFTGGIGEHAAEVRRRVCLQLEWLGIRLNPEANARHELHIAPAIAASTCWLFRPMRVDDGPPRPDFIGPLNKLFFASGPGSESCRGLVFSGFPGHDSTLAEDAENTVSSQRIALTYYI
jgi:acetate kinase